MAAPSKIVIPGIGEIQLSAADHMASGGEGAVYLKKGHAIKLYLDPAKARAGGLEEKLKLLAQLKHPYIVAPLGPVFDKQHQFLGYYMPKASGVPLVKTFSNTWRDANVFTNDKVAQLVENMREAVIAAHDLGALMVDGNEMNYLAEDVAPRLIDVDSWQIGRFQATAQMPSIRDYHSPAFNEHTDWFAWGIVSFQVFTGIHPFKGSHPAFKKGDMEARMRAHASVFDPQVKLNSAVRDFSLIPQSLRNWYESVFQQGERSAPPSVFASPITQGMTRKLRVVQGGTGNVRHDKVQDFPGTIRHVSGNGVVFFESPKGFQAFDLQRRQMLSKLTDARIQALFANHACLIRHGAGFVYLWKDGPEIRGTLIAADRDPQPANLTVSALPLVADKFVVMGNRFFALNPLNENGMTELSLDTLGSRTVLSVKTPWPVLVQSTRFYDGFGIMDCLGTPFLVVPTDNALMIHKCTALRDYKVINGYARNTSLVTLHGLSRQDGQVYRLQMRLTGEAYAVLSADIVDAPELNVAVNAKGIQVAIFEDGEITVTNTLGTGTKGVSDKSIARDMQLFALPDGVYYHRERDVYRLSLS